MKSRTLKAALGIGAALIVLVAALWLTTRRPESRASRRVGVILSLTGPADFIGKPERDTLEQMLSDYKKHGHLDPAIELDIRDSGGQPEQALQLFDRFAGDPGMFAIIGPSTSGESIPLAERTSISEVPLLSLAASHRIVLDDTGKTRPWAFKFAQNDNLAAHRLLRTMINLGHKKVAVLYSNDGFGKSGADAFRSAANDLGTVTIQHDAPFPAELTDPEPYVTSLPSDLDAAMIWGTAPGPALLVKATRRIRATLQPYLSHGNASEAFITSAGPAAEGAIVVGSRVLLKREHLNENEPADAVILRYQELWRTRFSGSPSHFGGHARDALEALLQAISATPNPSRKSVRDALEKLASFHGVTGTFTFTAGDHAGLTEQAFQVYRVSGARFEPLRP